jgi:hypothetical protein
MLILRLVVPVVYTGVVVPILEVLGDFPLGFSWALRGLTAFVIWMI